MCRSSGGGTRACHIDHADNLHVIDDPMTVRDVMRHWGLQALKRLGWKVEDSELQLWEAE